jgi:DNA-binding IclR family transcriptional regulator
MVKAERQATAPRSAYRERNSTSDRTLDILGVFAPDRLSITANELAIELDVARSTAYRYLQTLTKSGFVEEDPSGGFRLGMRIFELAKLARQSLGLAEIVRPALVELVAATGETALLTRRAGSQIVCVEREEADTHHVRVSYERGSVLALNAGASALSLLAWEDEKVVDQLLATADLPSYTATSLCTPAAVKRELAKIRNQGYAVNRGSLDPDAIGVAAPIRDETGGVIGAISVVALSRRVRGSGVEKLVRLVRESAQRVSDTVALVAN